MGTWLSHRNWVDVPTATLTAASETALLVVENLVSRLSYKIWRDASLDEGNDSTWFEVDFGQVREVGCLVLMFPRSNLPSSYDPVPAIADDDKVCHYLDAETAGAGVLLDTGEINSDVHPNYGYHVYKLGTPVNARYWRCELTVPSRVADGFIDVCRAWAGPVIEPRVGVSFGVQHGWRSDSPVSTAARGTSEFVDPRESKRAYTMNFEWLTNAERDALEDLDMLMTTAGQFIVCREDLSMPRGVMLARQEKSTGFAAAAAHLRHQKSFQLVESL
jgi:hypothetical protein